METDKQVDVVWLGDNTNVPAWSLGKVWAVEPTPRAVSQLIAQKLPESDAYAWLFWHPAVGQPNAAVVRRVLQLPGNVWHAGLKLGTGGLPNLIDFVSSIWMFNCDPPATIEATSWRLCLRACLIQTEALRQMGGVRPDFESLDAAALEMGHRYISQGVLTRHIPWLIAAEYPTPIARLSFADELRFIQCRFSRFWTGWTVMRAVVSRCVSPQTALRIWLQTQSTQRPTAAQPYRHPVQLAQTNLPEQPTVTVLIPTVDRYPYLRKLLTQLRQQTITPQAIIIIDQTEPAQRDPAFAHDFPDLPIHLIYLDSAGQCSSRNAGLRIAGSEFILFIDDDDEVPPDLIENHLRTIGAFRVDVSSGVAAEVGAGALPENFTYIRAGDVFPTNNTLIRRCVLEQSGLFDLAYERMSRADGDLGMRVYLCGTLMLLNPNITVLHHHAPRGGLRKHKARVVTYASSRTSLWQRHLPGISEVYLGLRYFTPRQVKAGLWLSAFGTFAVRGGKLRKLSKVLISCVLLPDTLRRLRHTYRAAVTMLRDYPQIPRLGE
ncbi:MAG: glycosyltransferase family 2 protein [Anaerolineae bacterium]|nr:glycosyltransferase family 2 protein [Anaerolineae bacterium]